MRSWRKAKKDISARLRPGPGIYSETGIWGDATLATALKARAVVEATTAGILRDIEALRESAVP